MATKEPPASDAPADSGAEKESATNEQSSGGDKDALKKSFLDKSSGGKLEKPAFKELVLASCKKKPPSDKDLDAAFELADTDESGTVDEAEFLALMALVEKGEVTGLSKSSMMFSSKKKRASFLAKLSSELPTKEEEAEAPDKTADEREDNATAEEEPKPEPAAAEEGEEAEEVEEDEQEEEQEQELQDDEEEEEQPKLEEDREEEPYEEGDGEDNPTGEGDTLESFVEEDLVETACGEEGEDEYWMPARIKEVLVEEGEVDGYVEKHCDC